MGNNHIKKHVRNAKVVPYENKTIPKIEKKHKDKHPWDIKKHVRNAKVVTYENKTIPKIEKKHKDKHPWDIAQE